MWLLHVQLILIELVNISGIYCEMSNPTLSNIIGHKVHTFFAFNLYKSHVFFKKNILFIII